MRQAFSNTSEKQSGWNFRKTLHKGQITVIPQRLGKCERNAVKCHNRISSRDITLTWWFLISLSITVMMKSLARAKFVAPILSELSTIKARSTGAHLHSADTKYPHK